MKMVPRITLGLLILAGFSACSSEQNGTQTKIVFLHHSTGGVIWKGNSTSNEPYGGRKAQLPLLFKAYNKEKNTDFLIEELEFPKAEPYGWNNDPFDYYNIWVKNAGDKPYMEEPTLEILTSRYNVIIFKHCYPVTNIQQDGDSAEIDSKIKTLSNYKLQYLALRDKIHQFPDNKFILFTGAVHVKAGMTEDEALRSKQFHSWVTEEWDIPDDNIFLWDLYSLQTEGELYFKDEYAVSENDSHPNPVFAEKAANLLFSRIIDVITTDGNKTTLTGASK